MRYATKTLLAGVIVGLSLSATTFAKVFERWGSAQGDGPAAKYGWSLAYESKMNLNGIEGAVRVYGVEKSLPDVLDDLRAYYSQGQYSGEFFPGDFMAWGVGRDNKYAIRYFLQQGANEENTLVYEIRQSLKEYKKSLGRALEHHLLAVPIYPGSKPTFFMHDYGSSSALEISSSSSSPEAVSDFYHQNLATQGWRARLGDAGSLRIFEKGREIIMVSASQGKDGETRITRMHKKLTVKKD